ncbi:p7 [Mint virus 1]|uniref:p7 n=1 Tax=Mint virus 1 TaxID=300740 RepID=Q5G7G5_9CLOS|nr:p7 [Mint virus 1]AAW32894.1 p7 [Mint virus 1]
MDCTLRAYFYLLLGWIIVCFSFTLGFVVYKLVRTCSNVYGDIIDTSVVGTSRRIDIENRGNSSARV